MDWKGNLFYRILDLSETVWRFAMPPLFLTEIFYLVYLVGLLIEALFNAIVKVGLRPLSFLILCHTDILNFYFQHEW